MTEVHDFIVAELIWGIAICIVVAALCGVAVKLITKRRKSRTPWVALPSVQPGEAQELRETASDWQKQLETLWSRVEQAGLKVFYDDRGMPAIGVPKPGSEEGK